jgi:hypothetical protein
MIVNCKIRQRKRLEEQYKKEDACADPDVKAQNRWNFA